MIRLPYGHSFLEIDEKNANVLQLKQQGLDDTHGASLVKDAMAKPYGGKTLAEMAKDSKRCTLIISDHTRPVPSKDIIPSMLEELRSGNPDIDITLLVATGCHRGTTKNELAAKLGEDIVNNEKIVIHDAEDQSSNVDIGVLPSGARLVLDKLAADTDLLVSEGFIEPHFFAGFSGGRKSVLPGVCSRVTVFANHNGQFIASPFARTGVLENNPIHRDMAAAAKMAGLAYIVNVVINDAHNTVAAFAGDPFSAHEAGCRFIREISSVKAVPADIVVTTNGGAPLDQNIYQCVKSMTAAEASAKDGGVIIICAECADGNGGDYFEAQLRDCENPAELFDAFAETPADETEKDQWQSQILARILMNHPVIFVTRPQLQKTIEDMKMIFASTIKEALDKARAIRGGSASITIIPNGVSVIVEP
ncbi:MAG: nickel-dependent lactate racemase [Clostridia bacterium]|nr:nickel-dependent lactate racemase [Clostridia bacterium]